jgi:hypothetical protein
MDLTIAIRVPGPTGYEWLQAGYVDADLQGFY